MNISITLKVFPLPCQNTSLLPPFLLPTPGNCCSAVTLVHTFQNFIEMPSYSMYFFPPSPASFIQKNYSEIHLCCSIYQIFITFYCIMVFHRKHIFYCTFKYSAADGHLGFLLAGGYYKQSCYEHLCIKVFVWTTVLPLSNPLDFYSINFYQIHVKKLKSATCCTVLIMLPLEIFFFFFSLIILVIKCQPFKLFNGSYKKLWSQSMSSKPSSSPRMYLMSHH